MARLVSGSAVDMSMITPPGATPSSTPPGPATTALTAASSVTMTKTTSAPDAASAGDAALRAPSRTRAASRPGVRFQTARSCPAARSRVAISTPIKPNPATATRRPEMPASAMRLASLRLGGGLRRAQGELEALGHQHRHQAQERRGHQPPTGGRPVVGLVDQPGGDAGRQAPEAGREAVG